ncbi:MAG: malto-oligosyltrehalose synthase [Syntrophobacteria bacterium]
MRIPAATYRIQFNPSFTFEAAKGIIPYLAELGISDLYASPIFKARKGSLHGYDIVDPNRLNRELGRESEFQPLIGEAQTLGLGWLQDIVPNHMAFDHHNRMLMDILENGQDSRYFHFFDIDWHHPYESIRGRLLAPFLGKFYGEALEDGEIKLKYDSGGFALTYYGWVFPLKIESYTSLLTYRLSALKKQLGRNHPDFVTLLGILYVLKTLPSSGNVSERKNQIEFIKRMLWILYSKGGEIKKFLDENIKLFNGASEDPGTYKLLDDLHSEQLFRLSFSKVATEEINYRRFFNINELISLDLKRDEVFTSTHSLIFQAVARNHFTGLRIDHIDGLYDPTSYLRKLRENVEDTFIIVEKILDLEEKLPDFWPVQGTTGYEFMNWVNGLFCKMQNEKAFSRIYTNFTGLKTDYEELVTEKKKLILGKHMGGDVDNLAHLLKTISSRDRYGGDITLSGLKRALVEIMAQFPVYRTYISQDCSRGEDDAYVRLAVARAAQSNPGLSNELGFIQRFLLLEHAEHLLEEEKEQRLDFIMRFQQLTGPLMAKGFEDTLLYVYNRLVSLNEVGGSPNRFGVSLDGFHRFMEQRFTCWPCSLNATSTHDTKRGEDIRARINVLSELPTEWESNLKTWSRINRGKKQSSKGKKIPDRNDEYFLYQTLVGVFPFYESEYPELLERLKAYIIKAVREAKVHTAWLKPDSHYEESFVSFVEALVSDQDGNPFLQAFLPFQKKVACYGIFNSLSQTLLKITSPGVPDFYQGTELWDLSLVDPDNRRPVDFAKRKALLHDVKERARRDTPSLIKELLESKEDGSIKLYLISRALEARKANPELFRKGTYVPLQVSGTFKDHIIAFARVDGSRRALSIAPRLLVPVVAEGEYPLGSHVWQDTAVVLPPGSAGSWKNALTGELIRGGDSLPVGAVLAQFPVALLLNEERT